MIFKRYASASVAVSLTLLPLFLIACDGKTSAPITKTVTIVKKPNSSKQVPSVSLLDLVVEQITVNPSPAYVGETLSITAVIENAGQGDIPAQTVHWWLRGAEHLELVAAVLPQLGPQEKFELSASVSAPLIMEGDYELEAVIFPSNDGLNVERMLVLGKAPTTVSIARRRPDLSVSILGLSPGMITSGAWVQLSIGCTNQGSLASASSPTQVYVVTQNGEARRDLVATLYVPELAPAESTIVNVNLRPLRGEGMYDWDVSAAVESADINSSNNRYQFGAIQIVSSSLSVTWQTSIASNVLSLSSWSQVNADSVEDILVGYGDSFGGLSALDGSTGQILWSFASLGGLAKGAVATGDFDNDGKIEIFGASSAGVLYALQATDGASLWAHEFGHQMATPTLADFDNDGTSEVAVVATFQGAFGGAGKIAVLAGATGNEIWSYPITEAVEYQSPLAVGDLNGDTYADFVVGSGTGLVSGVTTAFFSTGGTSFTPAWTVEGSMGRASGAVLADVDGDSKLDVLVAARDGSVKAIRGFDGSILWEKIYSGTYFQSSPALGDIDGDGNIDMVLSGGRGQSFDKLYQTVYALDASTGAEKWTLVAGLNIAGAGPILADIDANGSNEIIVITGGEHGLGTYTRLFVMTGSGGVSDVLEMTGTVYGSPAWVDVDGAGVPSILVATSQPGNVIKIATPYVAAPSAWPRFRGNAGNTGSAY